MVRRTCHRDGGISRATVATLHAWLLGKLAEMLGSREALTHELEAPMEEIDKWLRGDEPMPNATFLKAVDLLLELSRAQRAGELEAAPSFAQPAGHPVPPKPGPESR